MAKKPTEKKKPPAKKKPPVKKAPSGTLTERMGEVKNRPNKGLPARINRARGNPNRANPPKEIRMKGEGGTGRSLKGDTKFRPVPLGERPKLLSGPFGKAAKSPLGGIIRGGAVVTALTSIVNPGFMSYKTGGQAGLGSDKPSGKLFSPKANMAAGKANPKTVNPYKTPKAKQYPGAFMGGATLGGLFKPRREERNADMSKVKSKSSGGGNPKTVNPYKPKISMAGGGVNKPDSTAKDKVKRQQQGIKPDRKVSSVAPSQQGTGQVRVASKPKANKALPVKGKEMTFQTAVRRNMADEYIRNKMKPKGNLLDFMRSKRKK